MAGDDLTQEQFAELTVALTRIVFNIDNDPARQRFERVNGRLRPLAHGYVGHPHAPRDPIAKKEDRNE